MPGGRSNTAAGYYSFAAGRRAKANHDGTFVFTDNTDADFSSTAVGQFLIRASGGVGIGTTSPKSKLQVDGGVQVGDDGDTASADKVGTIRYRVEGTTSYAEMCMQTGAGTYAWIVVASQSW